MSSRMSSLPLARPAAVLAVSALALLPVAVPASAHVTANVAGTAEQGGFAKVSFRVPNERDDAATTKLEIFLPAAHPLAFVSVRAAAGWSAEAEKSKLATPVRMKGSTLTRAVAKIVWTGGQIGTGRFEEFDVSMGPLPTNVTTLAFTAVQTYSDGEVVRWDQPHAGGAEEPEHPAPMIELVPASQAEGAMAHNVRQSSVDLAAAKSGDADEGTARALGWLGLAAGLAGLVLGGLSLLRGRRRA